MAFTQPTLLARAAAMSGFDVARARMVSHVRYLDQVEAVPAGGPGAAAWPTWSAEKDVAIAFDWIDLVSPDAISTANITLVKGALTETVRLGYVGGAAGARKWMRFKTPLFVLDEVAVSIRLPDLVAGNRYSVFASVFVWRPTPKNLGSTGGQG